MSFKNLICVVIITLSFLGCQSNSSNNNVTYQSAKMTLLQKEQATPISFLKITNGTYKKNLLDTWVIEGYVTSTATVANYKDVVITVSYYTKTKTLLGTQDFQQYEYVKPGSSVPFKIKSDGYQSTEIIGVDVKRASLAN